MDETVPSIPNRRSTTSRLHRSPTHQPRSKAFTVINKQLYKRNITQILQKCIDEEDGKALLLEIHVGTCGHHASSRVLLSKAFRAGFYRPMAMKNSEDIVRHCIACQKFAS